MKKEELINIVVSEFGVDKIVATDFIDNLFSVINSGFKKGKRLNIPEFGKFILVSKKNENNETIKSISFSPVKKFSFDVNSRFNNLNPIPVALLLNQKDDSPEYYDFELDDDVIEVLKDEETETETEIKITETPETKSIENDTNVNEKSEIQSHLENVSTEIEQKTVTGDEELKDDLDNLIEKRRKSFFDSDRYLKGKSFESEEPSISDKIISDSLTEDKNLISESEDVIESVKTDDPLTGSETPSENDLIKKLSELDLNFSNLQSQIENSVDSEIENKDLTQSKTESEEKKDDDLFKGIDINKIQDEINAKLKETFKSGDDNDFIKDKLQDNKELKDDFEKTELNKPDEPEIKSDEPKISFDDVFEDKDKIKPVSESKDDEEIKIPDIDFQKIFSENVSETHTQDTSGDLSETFEGSDILIPDDIKKLHSEIETEKPDTEKSLIPEDDDFNFIKNYSDIFENKSDDEIKETIEDNGNPVDLPPVYTRPPEEEKESNKIFSLSVLLVIVITVLVFATTYFLLTSDLFSPKRLPVITDTLTTQQQNITVQDTILKTTPSDTSKIKIIGGDTFRLNETEIQKSNETFRDTVNTQKEQPVTNNNQQTQQQTTQQNQTQQQTNNQQTTANNTNQESGYRNLKPGEEEQINDPANGVVYVRTTDGVFIQTGSFKSKADADKKAGALQKSGLNIQIKEANLGDKGVWFRVRAGKFSSVEEAKNNVAKLK